MTGATYRGRFSPSPTGPLHFGSLVAALGSCLEARANNGQWLLRMEDVDEPRCSRVAASDMLKTLEACGFAWDGAVVWQSERKPRYAELLDQLKSEDRVYPCACTRRELADSSLTGLVLAADGALVYPGTCREGLPPGRVARAWRLRVDVARVDFDDAIQDRVGQQLDCDVGDFVLLRADGYFAYQLAVVADDADAGITHVVRGADLLDSTPRQIFLQRCLGMTTPNYAHLPVAVNAQGEKLSKQTLAPAIDPATAGRQLHAALAFLGQSPPPELARVSVAEFWRWAHHHWTLTCVPKTRSIEV